jgi:hypothetical protein
MKAGFERLERRIYRCGQHLVESSTFDEQREMLNLSLISAVRQKQTQFTSSSSNGGDVTSKLSRHRWHSFLPLREFEQQLDLLFGPFAGFCMLHCCPRSDRNLHQLRLRFGRDEGGRSSPAGPNNEVVGHAETSASQMTMSVHRGGKAGLANVGLQIVAAILVCSSLSPDTKRFDEREWI